MNVLSTFYALSVKCLCGFVKKTRFLSDYRLSMRSASNVINLVTFHLDYWLSVHIIEAIFWCYFGIISAYGSGQLTILECSDQVQFKKTDKLDGKHIGQVFRALTGHSITESVPLKMQIVSPFDLPEKVCLINLHGVKDFTPQNLKPKSEIDIVGIENSYEAFTNKLYEEGSSIVHIHLNDGLAAVRFCSQFKN